MFCLYEGTRETASRLLRVGFRAAALGPEDAQDVLVAEPRGALVGLVVEGAPLPPQEEEGVEVSLGGRERGEEKPGLEVVLARAEGPLEFRSTRVKKSGWSARRDWSNGVQGGRVRTWNQGRVSRGARGSRARRLRRSFLSGVKEGREGRSCSLRLVDSKATRSETCKNSSRTSVSTSVGRSSRRRSGMING